MMINIFACDCVWKIKQTCSSNCQCAILKGEKIAGMRNCGFLMFLFTVLYWHDGGSYSTEYMKRGTFLPSWSWIDEERHDCLVKPSTVGVLTLTVIEERGTTPVSGKTLERHSGKKKKK